MALRSLQTIATFKGCRVEWYVGADICATQAVLCDLLTQFLSCRSVLLQSLRSSFASAWSTVSLKLFSRSAQCISSIMHYATMTLWRWTIHHCRRLERCWRLCCERPLNWLGRCWNDCNTRSCGDSSGFGGAATVGWLEVVWLCSVGVCITFRWNASLAYWPTVLKWLRSLILAKNRTVVERFFAFKSKF